MQRPKPRQRLPWRNTSLVQREEEGWSVLLEEVKPDPEEHFFSSAELEQAPLIPAKRKAEDVPLEDEAGALTRPHPIPLDSLKKFSEVYNIERIGGTLAEVKVNWRKQWWWRPSRMGLRPSSLGAGQVRGP